MMSPIWPSDEGHWTEATVRQNPMSLQVLTFLGAEPPHTGKLATVRADGRPHVAPVWYALDVDGSVVFNTWGCSVKGKNLTHKPWASLCVDDERPPFGYVIVEGAIEISTNLADVHRWATEIGGRYMGVERAAEFGARNGVAGELLVRLRPTRVVSAFRLAD